MEEFTNEAKSAGLDVQAPATMINLQRCLATLNGVATATGAGNPRPSALWRREADALLAQHAKTYRNPY